MRLLTKYLAALGLAAAAAVTVHAQDSKQPPPLNLADMNRSAGSLSMRIQEDADHVARIQAVARKSKDVVKLTCVNDRIVELKAERNVFDASRKSFDGAAQSGGGIDVARPHFEQLSASAETVHRLRGEAEACVGVPELSKQENAIEVTHPDFPEDPTTEDPFSPDLEVPGYASPYGA